MDMQLKQLGLSFVLILAAAHTPADPFHRRGEREAVRAFQLQNITMDRTNGPQEDPQQAQRQGERRRNTDYVLPESSGYGSQAESNAEHNRKQGRMSPEERRALRRQIDEAGHDIYTPKR
jgi:hypothetical protein